MALATVLNALTPLGLKATTGGWMARCPGHEDRKASLSVGKGEDGRVLLLCMAGCKTEAIVAALGLAMADLFADERPAEGKGRIVAEYDYRDEKGARLYQVVRFDPKDFRQRKPAAGGGWDWRVGDVRKVLYRLPEVIAAPEGATVFVVEGEKDADKLAALGLVATTNAGGAGKWRPEYAASLKGKRVVILPDNDQPGRSHAAAVSKALHGFTMGTLVVELPGLPAKGDVSDWLAAGGTKERLMQFAGSGGSNAQPQAFQASRERLHGERAARLKSGSRVLSFGSAFLDDAMGGIVTSDVILAGGKTGVGKTEWATGVALHNARQGALVHYFALEAENREIERRMKFKLIAEEYYRSGFQRAPIRYLDWYMGRLDRELGAFEERADAALGPVLGNLRTFYRSEDFTSDDFRDQFESIRGETDLVVLDHLHYVDSADENENRGYKRTVKQIRDCALRAGKPVIVVAHVRKGDRRYEPLVPTIEDFHGSSDISKIATKAVMLAAAYDVPSAQPYLWNTYVQASKCRLDTSITRYVAMLVFNTRTNAYEEHYTLGRLTDGGKSFAELTESEMPSWARGRGANGYDRAVRSYVEPQEAETPEEAEDIRSAQLGGEPLPF